MVTGAYGGETRMFCLKWFGWMKTGVFIQAVQHSWSHPTGIVVFKAWRYRTEAVYTLIPGRQEAIVAQMELMRRRREKQPLDAYSAAGLAI